MAEGWSSQIRCRYFARGRCRSGEACRYLHDVNPTQPNHDVASSNGSRPSRCRYYNSGRCFFGPGCRNVHTGTVDYSTTPLEDNANTNVTFAGPSAVSSSDSGLPRSGRDFSELVSVVKNHMQVAEQTDTSSWSKWAAAPEFVPQNKCSSHAIECGVEECGRMEDRQEEAAGAAANAGPPDLCRHFESGDCLHSSCTRVHGDVCNVCGKNSLHPSDQAQRQYHLECCQQLKKINERKVEIKEGMARSTDKTCGVCFEVIMEKPPGQQRFGILPNCNHCFCLLCIRKWRQATQFENTIIRACPQCRVASDFVCPSLYWADTKEQKDKLITDYKEALEAKDCKYFKSGAGKCPFGNKCFYRHAFPDGTKADVGPPRLRQRRQRDLNIMEPLILWTDSDEEMEHDIRHLRSSLAAFTMNYSDVTFGNESSDSDDSDQDWFEDILML